MLPYVAQFIQYCQPANFSGESLQALDAHGAGITLNNGKYRFPIVYFFGNS